MTQMHIVPVGEGRRVSVASGADTIELPAMWLRERSTTEGSLDPDNLQRLYDPAAIDPALAVTDCSVDNGTLLVSFTDGHLGQLEVGALRRDLQWDPNPEEPPGRQQWHGDLDPFPYIDYNSWDFQNPATFKPALKAYFSYGFYVLQNLPTKPGTLESLAHKMGNLIPTNFGSIFNVITEPNPTDLAYTGHELRAHTDGPYRKPVPGIQILHCLANGAPGGDSTLVDGYTASERLKEADPDAYKALCDVDVDFRYDSGSDVVVNRTRMIQVDDQGKYEQFRFSHRLDYVTPAPASVLEAWYRGRAWMSNYLNERANNVYFRLTPGDAMVMDNHRLLHGRTAYDSTQGSRHLQGCYLDHDGPDTMWRLAIRSAK